MTDKSKRPLKKRHASLHQHQPTNRVNKFLAQAIEARSNNKSLNLIEIIEGNKLEYFKFGPFIGNAVD